MNVKVTSTTNTISVDFGDYYGAKIQFSKATYRKDHIESIKLDSFVQINVDGENTWTVSNTASEGILVIDSVDGVAPTSLEDLYNKLIALIA